MYVSGYLPINKSFDKDNLSAVSTYLFSSFPRRTLNPPSFLV